MRSETSRSFVAEEDFLPCVAEVRGDDTGDTPPVRAVGVGGVQHPSPWYVGSSLDERSDVHGCTRMISPSAASGEQHGGSAVEHPLDEVPLPRLAAPGSVDLRGAENRHGMPTRQEHLLRGDLGRPVAFPRVVACPIPTQRRLVLGDRGVEARGFVGVRVAALGVDVHRLAGEHHGGRDVSEQREEPLGLGGRVARAVHEEIGPSTEELRKCGRVVPVCLHEAGPRGEQLGGHVLRRAPRHRRRPPAGKETASHGPAHPASPAEDHRPPHRGDPNDSPEHPARARATPGPRVRTRRGRARTCSPGRVSEGSSASWRDTPGNGRPDPPATWSATT